MARVLAAIENSKRKHFVAGKLNSLLETMNDTQYIDFCRAGPLLSDEQQATMSITTRYTIARPLRSEDIAQQRLEVTRLVGLECCTLNFNSSQIRSWCSRFSIAGSGTHIIWHSAKLPCQSQKVDWIHVKAFIHLIDTEAIGDRFLVTCGWLCHETMLVGIVGLNTSAIYKVYVYVYVSSYDCGEYNRTRICASSRSSIRLQASIMDQFPRTYDSRFYCRLSSARLQDQA